MKTETTAVPAETDGRKFYKTAKARVPYANDIVGGEYVSIGYRGQGTSGTHYFYVTGTQSKGKFDGFSVVYPEHHLSEFCL